MVTRDQLHRLVEALPPEAFEAAARLLERLGGGQAEHPVADEAARSGAEPRPSAERRGAPASLAPDSGGLLTEDLRRRLGPPTAVAQAPPLASIEEIAGDFWPERESTEEFEAAIRRWRDADRRRGVDVDARTHQDGRG